MAKIKVPISEVGMWRRTSHSGFSLLELLIVLVIVGFLVSIAGLSVSSGSQPYKLEGVVRIFADISEYAMDEAQLSGTDHGLLLSREVDRGTEVYSYEWLQRSQTGWVAAVVDADIFAAKEFPPGLELFLEVEEGATDPRASEELNEDGEEVLQPQVIFYSSGETTPGTLDIVEPRSGELLWRLEWDLLGRMEMKRRGLENDDSQ